MTVAIAQCLAHSKPVTNRRPPERELIKPINTFVCMQLLRLMRAGNRRRANVVLCRRVLAGLLLTRLDAQCFGEAFTDPALLY